MDITFDNILDVGGTLEELVRTWRNSSTVNQFMITNHHISKKEHHQWLTNLKTKKNAKVWIIKYRDTPIGLAYLTHIDYEKKSTGWGFYIADESVRGKGVGSTTLCRLMEYVFETLRFQTMHTQVLENNTIAMHLYEKFGFTKDETKTESLERNGVRLGIFYMVISKETWMSIHNTLKPTDSGSLL
ncbi:MAG TPA: UDP-4-amino-4,6-dideoxy-N-acetyl-beta-L-altrosamine N-acetyltransferase [Candidatus Thermoplasmatota archaeon]|nr:UDP-4-amino-4,6-dideoxy-N-acetyl-beta-L-altrosamine N-acetyltransferase [Candidatus Thermoplasmatota archaeon]